MVSKRSKHTGTSTPGSSGSKKPAWNTMLRHVYHPARLKVLDSLMTVTGKVVHTKAEPDGDIHIILDNGMECEIICAGKVTQADAKQACMNYKNSVKIPKVGNKIQVTGQHVYDLVHKQQEIHPVFELKVIG
jgi:transcription elongation factor